MNGKKALEIIVRKHCVSENDKEDEELECLYDVVEKDLEVLNIIGKYDLIDKDKLAKLPSDVLGKVLEWRNGK